MRSFQVKKITVTFPSTSLCHDSNWRSLLLSRANVLLVKCPELKKAFYDVRPVVQDGYRHNDKEELVRYDRAGLEFQVIAGADMDVIMSEMAPALSQIVDGEDPVAAVSIG